jgi:ABC-type transporter Mla subunit MlaD
VTGAGFRIDPPTLAAAGQAVAGCAQELGQALQGLQATVTSGNPWGADEPGTLFGAAYTEALGHALQVYASHAEQLGYAAEGLATWARTVTETDQAESARISAIAGPGA